MVETYDINVISIKKDSDRRKSFEKNNNHMTGKYTYFDAIDSREHWAIPKKSRVVNRSHNFGWTRGSIGCGLSHLYLWQQCAQSTKPKIIIEDDALISRNFEKELAFIFKYPFFEDLDICMLGHNLDSVLITDTEGGLRSISLFTPEYPDQTLIRKIIDSNEARSMRRLHSTFGLAGYVLKPKGAKKLLTLINKFENIPSKRDEEFLA